MYVYSILFNKYQTLIKVTICFKKFQLYVQVNDEHYLIHTKMKFTSNFLVTGTYNT